MIRTAILTVERDEDSANSDAGIASLRNLLAKGPFSEVDFATVSAQQALIRAQLRRWADAESVDLILTVGGVGVGLRDRVPEATEEVVDRQFPGVGEVMRAAGAKVDPLAGLWRGIAGLRGETFIVNLPAGEKSSAAALAAIGRLVLEVNRSVVRSGPEDVGF